MKQYLEFDTPQGSTLIDVDKILAVCDITKGKVGQTAAEIDAGLRCKIYTTVGPDDYFNCTEYYAEVRDRLADLAVRGNAIELDAKMTMGDRAGLK